MRKPNNPGFLTRSYIKRRKIWWLALAALPMMQTTGCFPDPIGAFNFELQLLINSTLTNAVNIIVRNILGL